jgi:hypothetical protein
MATQYSNKPIVTNGLVYALDFGNQKSYVSGSSSARNLKFDSITGSILTFGGASIPNLQNGLLKMVAPTSTTGSTVNTLQQFSDLIPSGDFTIQLVATFPASAIFITQGPSATRLISDGNGMFGWYINPIPYGGGSNYKTITKNIPTGLKHITYRYSSGSYDMFVNGVPMPTTARGSSTSTNTGTLTINGYGSIGLNLATQDLGNFYIYDRALTSNEIYSNYLIQAQRYGLPTVSKPYTIDENAYLFLSQSGITDPIITSSINTFVLGLKSASLWDKMIAIYPFVGTGSVGVNLTGSQSWNLKDPTTAFYKLGFTGSWNGSTSGSTPSGSGTAIDTGVLPYEYYPFKSDSNQHLSILSYDTPVSSSILAGTGMTKELAVSTLAGDYGTPAAAYSVRKVRTAYSGALMDVRRSIDNVTSSIGYVSNGDLDTGSLLDFVLPGRSTLPGNYSGLAAAYSLRRVSASYSGNAIDVRRIWDNTTSSIGFDASGNLDTGSLLSFTTSGSNILLNSNDFSSNAKYSVQVTSSAILGPYGIGSGSFINETNATSFHSFDYNINPVNTSSVHTISCFVKKQERRYVGLAFAYNSTNYSYVNFDLNTTSSINSGSAGTGYSFISSSINFVTDGWFRLSLTGTAGLPDFYPRLFLSNNSSSGFPTYTGEPGTGSYVYGFQYTTGSTVQPYIETTGTARYNVGNTSSFGYVTKWYDQSGNARHATQTVTGSQPLIVSSGSLVTENGRPALRFLATNSSSLNLPNSPLSGSNAFGLYAIANFSSSNSYEMLYAEAPPSITTGVEIRRNSVANSLQYITGDGTYPAGTASIDNRQILISINRNALVSNTAFVNGALDATLATSSNVITSTSASIGRRYGDDYYFDGTIQEMSFFTGSAASSSRALIENNINTYYNVYTSSNAGYVAKWYDQSGNNRHATQTTTGSQPLIVESGSVILDNNRPSLAFSSSILTATTPNVASPQSIYGVNRLASAGDSQYHVYFDGGTSVHKRQLGQNSTNSWYWNAGNETVGSSSNNSQSLWSALFGGAGLYINGILQTATSAGGNNWQNTVIGGRYDQTQQWTGSIQEITVYNTNLSTNREPIEYGINSYYNIYPQTSSFSTSSFTIYATTSSISASINNELQSGIASSGPLGFITVSRTGSNSLTLARNGVTSSFAVPASGALSTNLYLGAINNNGLALGSSPYNISFASVGVGLTGTEIQTLNRLVYQANYYRDPSIITNGLTLNLDSQNPSSYPGSGNTWFNLSGSIYNATLSNGFSYSNNTGGILVFDGANNTGGRGVITDYYPVFSGDFTINLWVNFSTYKQYQNIISSANDGNATQGFWVEFGSGRGFTMYSNSSDIVQDNLVSLTALSTNTWHNVCVTRVGAGSNNVKLYVDNVVCGQNTSNLTIGNINQNLEIARYSKNDSNNFFQGSIARIQIYNSRGFSSDEVSQNFNTTRGRFGV